VLRCISRHDEEWESGHINPRIPYLGVGSFTPWPLYLREKSPVLIRYDVDGPRSRSCMNCHKYTGGKVDYSYLLTLVHRSWISYTLKMEVVRSSETSVKISRRHHIPEDDILQERVLLVCVQFRPTEEIIEVYYLENIFNLTPIIRRMNQATVFFDPFIFNLYLKTIC
jgi:hypothetical protein